MADVDVPLISSYTSFSEANIRYLIDQPSPDLVTNFLQNLVSKAQDHNRLKSERLRLDVEHENAVRGAETQARQLRTKAESATKEAEALKYRLSDEEKARTELQAQIDNLKNSTTTSTAESQALHSQIARLEKSNRDTLSLLNSKSSAHDKLTQDLATHHQKAISSRREVSELNERIQGLENTINNSKFKESQLSSEAERLKRSTDWYESELKTKAAEHTKFRKEKNQRLAELQRANEDARQSFESAQRTEATLRRRLDEMGLKAEESLSKIQQLQEDAARREEDFRLERDRLNRLADLRQQSSETSRQRLEEVEQQLEQTRDDAANEIAEGQSELESERHGRETAEQRVEELESEVQQLQAQRSNVSRQDGYTTPRKGVNGLTTPGRGRSPAPNTPGGRSASFQTGLVSENNDLKMALEHERRQHASLRHTFDELVRELEEKEPELTQAQEERDHFESEITQLSGLLEEARQDRESAQKDGRKFRHAADASERKARLLEQQLRDLSVQIKVLLVEVQIREQGGELDSAQRDQVRRAASGGHDPQALEGMSDTAQFISQNLISFKDLFELQEKNAQMTKIVRELGEKREEEEARVKEAGLNQEEIGALKQRVERYQDEVKTLTTQCQSYIRERDMFRRMVSHRGKLPADADLESTFGASVNGAATPQTPQRGNSVPVPDQSPASKDLADHVKLLRELQSHFDTYKQETAKDYTSAKDRVDVLSKEKGQLQNDFIRANSQVTLLQERYQMLQSNNELLKIENAELQKRTNSLHEAAAKQDVRTQQVAEDLVEAQSLSEGLRNENANLKAEKELFRRVETRLNEDNQSLVNEKGRLNKIITDTQNLANERELSDSEARRKLQAQVDTLEAELQALRRKFEEEVENSKNASLRREYEQEQSRTRIDDLVKSLSNVKEELVAAKTTRDQLQSRVDELKIDLRSAEERTQALQPRPTPRPAQTSDAEDNDASHEQQLAMQLIEVKRELELAKTDLENARAEVEQYRSISRSAEEELASINEAHDQYKEDADKVASEKDDKINDLEQRLEEISSELSTTSQQMSELRASAADHDSRVNQQREAFESELRHIKDECERQKETASFHLEDLKAQAEVAERAQQNYDTELVKHAEAAQALKKVRDELNQVKLEVSHFRSDAEAARMSLGQSEDSWSSTKEQYERELTELKTRRDEVNAQNNLLHTQLESVSKQISSLQQARSTPAPDASGDGTTSSDTSRLQEVIQYLRREKEIVDVQHELSTQESRRLRQQLDYQTNQLDEARSRLDQERQRQAERESGAASHGKLMETLNELNVFRESSVTLRSEARSARAQVEQKSKEIAELRAQIEPLETSVRELEGSLDAAQRGKTLSEEHANSLQQRISNILQKYDRIDPAEHEGLKAQITQLEAERDELSAKVSPLQERIDGIEAEKQAAIEENRKELREKLNVQFKAKVAELRNQNKASTTELDSLKLQLETAQAQINTANEARDEAVARADAAGEAGQSGEEGQVDEGEDARVSREEELQSRLSKAEDVANERQSDLEVARSELQLAQNKIAELQQQISQLQSQLDATGGTTGPQAQASETRTSEPQPDAHFTKLKEDLAAAQSELEALRMEASSRQAQANVTAATEDKDGASSEQQLQARRDELEAAYKAKELELEQKSNTRNENFKQQAQKKLNEAREGIRKELEDKTNELQSLQQQLQDLRKGSTGSSATVDVATQATSNGVPPTPTTPASATVPAASQNAFNDDSTVNVKAEVTSPTDIQWTRQQIQEFISTNADCKSILVGNVKKRVDQETAKLKQILEADMAVKLTELQDDADKDTREKLEAAQQTALKKQEQAVNLSEKKHSLKTNVAENKARGAQAKLDVVSKAAAETPQKPVVEVWEVAKLAKPAPAPVQAQAQPAAGPSGQAPSPKPQSQPTQQQPSQITAPTSTVAPAPSAVSEGQKPETPTDATTAKPEQADIAHQTETSTSRPGSASGQAPPTQPAGTGPAALRGLANQAGSGIPRGGASIRGAAQRGGRGGGPASDAGDTSQITAPSGPQASQQSRGRGGQSGLPRGGMNVRGGGGRGRGYQQGGGSPGRGGMNPGAHGFVPGNKRPREDSQGGENKRPRGGGQGQ